MPKYDVSAKLTISTTIEPQGYIDEPSGSEISDWNQESFTGYGTDIEETCEITFVLDTETTDEDDASSEAEDILNNTSYTGDDIEWEVTDVSIESIERQQMDTESAVRIIRTFLDSRDPVFTEVHGEVAEALETLLQQF